MFCIGLLNWRSFEPFMCLDPVHLGCVPCYCVLLYLEYFGLLDKNNCGRYHYIWFSYPPPNKNKIIKSFKNDDDDNKTTTKNTISFLVE